MSGIRLGDIPDMDAICELGMELLDQSVYAGIKPDNQKFRTMVAGMMGSKKGLVLVVVDDANNPQGFLVGMIDDLFFSRERYATDIAVYVREGFRNLAPSLFKRFITWARSKPLVNHVMLGISSGIGDQDKVGRMYNTLGFDTVGSIHFKRL